ncbi:hypothetical protein [Streptomyces sp. PsTaAH-124]|uniref:hypothetical protein n=1 Tax=Streptomyces sp. PsTaAH-124 TaxID=1157638 RepID=UPI00036419EE|nr:hypothetical protein [Streptomyces sp. PsTaAH-124]
MVRVTGLTNGERAVALYASDMPGGYRFGRGDDGTVMAWVLQGVARLGFKDVYDAAGEVRYYGVLRQAGRVTAEVRRGVRRRFPDRRRLECAERTSAMLTYRLADVEPESGWVGDDTFKIYRAYGDDIDEVGV